MKTYIKYEITQREFSSNVITGVYIYVDEKGKQHEKKDLLVHCFLNKKDADLVIETIFNSVYKTKTL